MIKRAQGGHKRTIWQGRLLNGSGILYKQAHMVKRIVKFTVVVALKGDTCTESIGTSVITHNICHLLPTSCPRYPQL